MDDLSLVIPDNSSRPRKKIWDNYYSFNGEKRYIDYESEHKMEGSWKRGNEVFYKEWLLLYYNLYTPLKTISSVIETGLSKMEVPFSF